MFLSVQQENLTGYGRLLFINNILLSLRVDWSAGTSLVVQWLGLHASNAGGAGSIPGPGTKIPHAMPKNPTCHKKKKRKKNWSICIFGPYLATGSSTLTAVLNIPSRCCRSSSQWAFGVTLWELMTLGQTPYVDIDPFEMAAYLKDGYRIAQPINCPDEL